MRNILVLLGFLMMCQIVGAQQAHVCNPVGSQCVGLIVRADGTNWLADRVVENGQYVWSPFKKARCSEPDGDRQISIAHDPTYGDYECVQVGVAAASAAARKQQFIPAKRAGGLGHYIRTHKTLLVTDAVFVLSSLADSASTVHCLRTNPFCSEENPLLPRHPSAAQLYGLKLGLTAGFITTNHFWVHSFRNDPKDRREKAYELAYVGWTAPLVVVSITSAKHNVGLSK